MAEEALTTSAASAKITATEQKIANRAKSILRKYAVKRLAAFVLTCKQSSETKMWRKLERATLMTFKDKYGSVPCLNKQGKNYKSRAVFHYFSEDSLLKKLLAIEQMKI